MADASDDDSGFGLWLSYLLDDASYKKVTASLETVNKKVDELSAKRMQIRLEVDDSAKDKIDKLFAGMADMAGAARMATGLAKLVAKALKEAWAEGIDQPLQELYAAKQAGLSNVTVLGLKNASKAFKTGDVSVDAARIQQEVLDVTTEGAFNSNRALAITQLGMNMHDVLALKGEDRLAYLTNTIAGLMQRNSNNPEQLSLLWNRAAEALSPAFADLLMRVFANPASQYTQTQTPWELLKDFNVDKDVASKQQANQADTQLIQQQLKQAQQGVHQQIRGASNAGLTSGTGAYIIGAAANAVTGGNTNQRLNEKSELSPKQQQLQAENALTVTKEALKYFGNTEVKTSAGKGVMTEENAGSVRSDIGLHKSNTLAWASKPEFEARREHLGAYAKTVYNDPNTAPDIKNLWALVMAAMTGSTGQASTAMNSMYEEAVARIEKANPGISQKDLASKLKGYEISPNPDNPSERFLDLPKLFTDYPEKKGDNTNFLGMDRFNGLPQSSVIQLFINELNKLNSYLKPSEDDTPVPGKKGAFLLPNEETLRSGILTASLSGASNVSEQSTKVQIELSLNGKPIAEAQVQQGSSVSVKPAAIDLNRLGGIS